MSLISNLVTAILKPHRMLGPITAQVTIEERHFDELVITNHPVELGAQISDHAYKNPAEVTIRVGFSNSGLQSLVSDLSDIVSIFNGNSAPSFDYIQKTYDQFLQLQASRVLFDIVTGKRNYKNMLFRSLAVTTDSASENALFLTAVCREVLVVSTQLVNLPNQVTVTAPREDQRVPQETQPLTQTGTQQVTPFSNSSDESDIQKLGGSPLPVGSNVPVTPQQYVQSVINASK